MFVKICGITRIEDAELAAELGATAIGFIQWPKSPRFVTRERAAEIARRVRGRVQTVGVFVNEAPDSIREAVREIGLDAVQLHGDESAADCRAIGGSVIKAIGLNGNGASIDGFDESVLLLLDAHDPEKRGGTGRTIDWNAARNIAAGRRTLLSGGLTPQNVRQAIEAVKPFGIDVSSGVESSPGVKDPARMRALFEALHG